jgi:hypothetical protein
MAGAIERALFIHCSVIVFRHVPDDALVTKVTAGALQCLGTLPSTKEDEAS